jgi:two-component system sensor histidine kinase BaeS
MMPLRSAGLATRLMFLLVLVIAVGSVTLVVATDLLAPGLFRSHLMRNGERSPMVLSHAEQAFNSAFTISLSVATLAARAAAGLVSLFLVRRVAHPVQELAAAADAVAAGNYRVEVPAADFSSEFQRLSAAFTHMAGRLADTDAARSRLLSDLAHELRTPLATLEAYLDGIEDGVVADDAASREVMRTQLRRLRRLATDVREVAAAEEDALTLQLAPCSPAELVQTAVAAVRPRYQHKAVDLRLEAGPLPTVTADAERLQQVLSNLLDNALRHTPSGGHVSVRASAPSGGEAVSIVINDDGEGLPIDQRQAVFQRFHRVDPARSSHEGEGSGLGLTIARAIMTAHRGTLVADSDGPGLGATFTMTLPVRPHLPAPGLRDPGAL